MIFKKGAPDIDCWERKMAVVSTQSELHSGCHQYFRKLLGQDTEDQSASVCNLLWKLSAMKETSQAFSWQGPSALSAEVNLSLDSPLPRSERCICVCVPQKRTRTYTHTDWSTCIKRQWVIHAGIVPTRLSARREQEDGEEGGSSCSG